MDVDMEVEVTQPTSPENTKGMEEAANIAASAFGDDHLSVRAMRQEFTKKKKNGEESEAKYLIPIRQKVQFSLFCFSNSSFCFSSSFKANI
jgi:hypothetical protein